MDRIEEDSVVDSPHHRPDYPKAKKKNLTIFVIS